MEASAPFSPRTSSPSRTGGSRARCGSRRGCCGGAVSFFFLAFLFAYFYLRSLDVNRAGRSARCIRRWPSA